MGGWKRRFFDSVLLEARDGIVGKDSKFVLWKARL
jgi:hypothetical protein